MPEANLSDDPLLKDIPEREGYKVLGGVVLYQKLGQGGMGAVYRGKHLRLNTDVAVKVMALSLGLPPEQAESYVKRFVREAQTAVSASHQNLIRVYDVDTESGVHFIIMDFVDGESAGDRLKRKGKLSEEEAVEICLGAASGLGEAHRRGIVHRDVKPDNIMIDKEGRVRVTDLGLAKAYSAEADTGKPSMLTQTQAGMGTPYYMSPEQFRAARDVGPAADVWSLGVTLYHLLIGKVPWSDTSVFTLAAKIQNDPLPDPKQMCAGLSGGVCEIIEKAVQKDPSRRYANCAEMANGLRAYFDAIRAGGEGVLADAEAGATKMALASVTPPPFKTLTLIGKTLLGPSDSERLTVPERVGTPASAAVETPALGRGGLPAWVVPASLVGGLVLLGVILWAALGAGRTGGEFPAGGQTARSDPIEAEAQRFLGRLMAVAADGRLEEAARVIEEAGTRYDATSTGPKIARLAETTRTKLAAQKRQKEEWERDERERAGREKEAKLADLLSRANRAEKAGDLAEARRLLAFALEMRDDPAVSQRIAGLDERLEVEKVIVNVEGHVEAREWRSAWSLIEKAREDGVADSRLDSARRRVVKELAPKKSLTGPLGVQLVLVPAGSFVMGSDSGPRHEQPAHQVTLSSFYVGKYEVTKEEFDAFRRKGRRNRESPTGIREPVTSVSWEDAVEFCRYLASVDPQGATHRLPTEAEWEFVARGSSGRTYPWGNEPPGPKHTNLVGSGDGFKGVAPVGSFPRGATPEGIMDLVGNVAEWCLDRYGRYSAAAQTDPTGPDKGKERIVRGSAWAYEARAWSRASARTVCVPEDRKDTLGFRVVRELTDEEKRFLRIAGGG